MKIISFYFYFQQIQHNNISIQQNDVQVFHNLKINGLKKNKQVGVFFFRFWYTNKFSFFFILLINCPPHPVQYYCIRARYFLVSHNSTRSFVYAKIVDFEISSSLVLKHYANFLNDTHCRVYGWFCTWRFAFGTF